MGSGEVGSGEVGPCEMSPGVTRPGMEPLDGAGEGALEEAGVGPALGEALGAADGAAPGTHFPHFFAAPSGAYRVAHAAPARQRHLSVPPPQCLQSFPSRRHLWLVHLQSGRAAGQPL